MYIDTQQDFHDCIYKIEVVAIFIFCPCSNIHAKMNTWDQYHKFIDYVYKIASQMEPPQYLLYPSRPCAMGHRTMIS